MSIAFEIHAHWLWFGGGVIVGIVVAVVGISWAALASFRPPGW